MTPLEKVLSRLDGVKKVGSGWIARCPVPWHGKGRGDTNPSLGVGVGHDGRVLLKCHAGCPLEEILNALGLKTRDLFPEDGITRGATRTHEHQNGASEHEIVATHDYKDEEGNLLFQVVRYHPKDFRQRRPDGNRGWIWNLDGVRLVLYRLPEVIAAVRNGVAVIVVEGEKDADNLAKLGFVTTTNPMGASKWKPEYSEMLLGAHVVIIPDNDKPGLQHAEKVAQSLYGKAASIKVARLPDGIKDVSEWIEAGATRENIESLARWAPEWTPPSEKKEEDEKGEEKEYHLTDVGNAERLIDKYGEDLRYCYAQKQWYFWDGRRWVPDVIGEVERRAVEVVRDIYAEASRAKDATRRHELARHAIKSEAKERIKAMIEMAHHLMPIKPSDFDANPWLLNVTNGTIDLRTGELRPHCRKDYITRIIPIEYDPNAKAPRWGEFLYEIMDGNEELISFLQRTVGYSLTGDVSEQVLFMCYGIGANGKTVFLRTLLALFGPYGKQVEPRLLLKSAREEHPTAIADLFGVRLAVAVEIGEGERFNEPILKWLTGGEIIKARFMRQDYFAFEPTHKFWIATNHKPTIRGTDLAIWRRIRLIPFNVVIPEEKRDPRLAEKLRTELKGILAWAVRGCLEWQKKGLAEPDEVKLATQRYREEQDVLAAFLSECCILHPRAEVPARDLYEAYVKWCVENGERVESQRQFGMRLTERGFERYRGTGGTYRWRGIGLKSGDGGTPSRRDEPVTDAPTASEPNIGEPAAREPVTSKPVTSEPTASIPTTSESATSVSDNLDDFTLTFAPRLVREVEERNPRKKDASTLLVSEPSSGTPPEADTPNKRGDGEAALVVYGVACAL